MKLDEAQRITSIIRLSLDQDYILAERILIQLRREFSEYDWALTPEGDLKIGWGEYWMMEMEHDLGELVLERESEENS